MKVGFFRHGPAVPHGTAGIADDERPLTPEGRTKTRKAAQGLRRLGLGFDAVYTSPLPRALQTAQILSDVLRLPAPKPMAALRPETGAAALLQAVRAVGKGTPLFVGHEPSLSESVSKALRAVAPGSLELKKAGLAVVELRRGGGTLLMLLPPSALRALAR